MCEIIKFIPKPFQNSRATQVMQEGIAAFRIAMAMAEHQGNEEAYMFLKRTVEKLEEIALGVGFLMSVPKGNA